MDKIQEIQIILWSNCLIAWESMLSIKSVLLVNLRLQPVVLFNVLFVRSLTGLGLEACHRVECNGNSINKSCLGMRDVEVLE